MHITIYKLINVISINLFLYHVVVQSNTMKFTVLPLLFDGIPVLHMSLLYSSQLCCSCYIE